MSKERVEKHMKKLNNHKNTISQKIDNHFNNKTNSQPIEK